MRGGAPAWAWPLALIYAAYCYNRIGSDRGISPSPLELASGVVPDGSMLRVFWSPCFPLVHKEQGRGKFEPRSRGSMTMPCRFCGICDAAPAFFPDVELSWLYWDPQRVKVDHSAHMRFEEGAHMSADIHRTWPPARRRPKKRAALSGRWPMSWAFTTAADSAPSAPNYRHLGEKFQPAHSPVKEPAIRR